MRRNCGIVSVSGYSALLIFLLLISACGAKHMDVDESVLMLNLSEEQLEVVKPKLEAIRDIADTYDQKKEQLAEEISSMIGSGGSRDSGSRAELRSKFQEFRKQREIYLSAINAHADDIKAVLDEEQLATFEKIDLPELEMPERSRGRRRGAGGKGGGTGRRGGMGGGRRGDTF